MQGNDSGFGPKVRPKVGVTGHQKSELQWADPQNPNRIAQKRNPNRVEVLLQKTPLEAFLNPAKVFLNPLFGKPLFAPRIPVVFLIWGEAKVPPFLGSPLFHKAPPRQFQPPKCKLTPSKIQIVEGRFLCTSIQNCRLEVANPFLEGVNLHFGGCQFAFWRPKLSWGCFIEKG